MIGMDERVDRVQERRIMRVIMPLEVRIRVCLRGSGVSFLEEVKRWWVSSIHCKMKLWGLSVPGRYAVAMR